MKPQGSDRRRTRSGQTILEACLMVAMASFLLFGVLQVMQLYTAQQVLDHGAFAAARARAVGFNDFMVFKAFRAATIGNAGLIEEPEIDDVSIDPAFWGEVLPGDAYEYALTATPSSPQFAAERSRIPLYMGAWEMGDLPAILDYDDWDSLSLLPLSETDPGLVRAEVKQRYRLQFPFHRAYYADDELTMRGEAEIDNHYPLYLETAP
jgi:hypothetical protein